MIYSGGEVTMSEAQQSLLAEASKQLEAQPFLFPELSQSEAYETLERHGEFTGERLAERRPRIYALVCKMIAERLSTRSIARACGVSPNTVEACRRREGASVDALKEELLAIVRSGARLCAERVQELAPEMDARDASVAFGILTEKLLLLSGEATVIIGSDERVKHEDFNALLEALPRADARVIEAEIGFGARPAEQTADAGPPAPPRPAPLPVPPAAASPPGPSDSQSLVLQSKSGPSNAGGNADAV
jgi:hypothetical protein